MKKALVYLASPYSKYPGGREEANKLVTKKAAELMEEGYILFAPIPHSHNIEKEMSKTYDGDWWLEQDFAVLKNCDKLVVYKIPGWEKSYGVKEEIKFAKKNKIPVEYIEYAPNT